MLLCRCEQLSKYSALQLYKEAIFAIVDHELYIKRCLELAGLAKGYVAPNPMVGAVLVHNDRIIGEGWHKHYGQAHAEVNCFENVAAADRHLIPESTMYVSLEPCAHHGKTPPCAWRIVNEKVKKVIICNIDPFEKVGGKGIEILNQHGIQSETGILNGQGLWLNRRFYCFHQQKRPYIILKWAQSANGFIAPADKSRLQLSNKHSKQILHQWRTEESAIMVGYNTALNDDPQLTARLAKGPQPLRIVLDRKLQLPGSLKLFDTAAETWVVNEEKEERHNNIHYVQLDFYKDILPQLMERLHAHGKLSLIVEGGASLLNSFLEKGLWDEARIFKTPVTITEGIAAPQITHGNLSSQMPLDADLLEVYVNNNSKYPYIQGMSL